MFVASLVADLVKVRKIVFQIIKSLQFQSKAMIYLHDSVIISHGNLKPSNCLVDSRWVLQVTDYGLSEFRSGQDKRRSKEIEEKRKYLILKVFLIIFIYSLDLLWRAPELLRSANVPGRGTQKGDVYS